MRTLVTGATGLVGNNVVRHLLDRGDDVRVLLRDRGFSRPFAGLDVEAVAGDVRDAEAVERACAGVERVIHAAARVHIGWTGGDLQHATNVMGTRHVARGARLAGARLVHVSSVDALGIRSRAEPADEETPAHGHVPCPYVLTKRAAEQAVRDEIAQGLDAVIVNPGYVLGPWDWKPSSGRMLLEIARGLGLLAPPGGNDFCDVRDVAQGILAAADQGQTGRRYILSGEPLSYFEAWQIFAEVTGARRPVGTARLPLVRFAGWVGDLIRRLTGHELDLNSAAAKISTLPHHFSSARAERELGYRSRPAREAAQAAWSWFQEEGYA